MSRFLKKILKFFKSIIIAWAMVMASVLGSRPHQPEKTDNKKIESDK